MAQALVAQANAAIKAGDFTRAHELLHEATQAQTAAAQEARKLLAQAQAAADAEMRGASSSTAAEGDVALSELHYKQAADLFKQAATLVPAGHADKAAGYLECQANALFRQGDERGDNAALEQSIAIWDLVLAQRPRDRVPLGWAQTQDNLGLALWKLGERESGTTNLEAAVATYRATLQDRTRDRVPLDWARTQWGLGRALETLGERESGTTHLEEAVAAWKACLTVTASVWPLTWVQSVQSHIDQAHHEIARRATAAR